MYTGLIPRNVIIIHSIQGHVYTGNLATAGYSVGKANKLSHIAIQFVLELTALGPVSWVSEVFLSLCTPMTCDECIHQIVSTAHA